MRFTLFRIYLIILLLSGALLGISQISLRQLEIKHLFHLPASQWEYALGQAPPTSGAWKPAPKLGFTTAQMGKELWLRTRLPYHQLRDPTLFIRRLNQNFEVFLGPQSIYRFGDLKKQPAHFEGYIWHMIRLPGDNALSELRIHLHSEHRFIGILDEVSFGSRGQIIQQMVIEHLGSFMLAVFYSLLGIALLCLSLFFPERFLAFSLGLFTLCLGLYTLCESDLTGLWLYQPWILTHLSLFSLYLMPGWAYLFMQGLSNIQPLHRSLRILTLLQLGYAGISLLLVMMGWPLMQTVLPFQLLSLSTLVYLALRIVYNWKQLDQEAHLISTGMLVFIGVAAYDLLVSIRVLPASVSLYPWGSLMFVTALLLLLLHRYWQRYREQLRVAAELQVSLSTQDELRRAKEASEEANQLKSQFLANLSHEIRTPLNAVLGFAECLEEELSEPQQRSYLQGIRSGGKSLLALLNDLLDLSKIEAGQMYLDLQPTDIRLVAQEIGQIFSLPLQQKGLQWQLEIAPEVPALLLLDELRIKQILLNLVGNAVKFTEQGEIRLRLGFTEDPPRLILSVTDTGIGIPKEAQELIFEPFRQQDGQSTRKYGGTGLGLAICRRLTTLMNGQIQVQSTPGKGSCFSVQVQTAVLDTKNRAVLSSEAKSSSPLDPPTLFTLDPALRMLLQEKLEPLCQELQRKRNLSRMRTLARLCQKMGHEHALPDLTAQGEALEQALQHFDIPQIQNLLEKLPLWWQLPAD